MHRSLNAILLLRIVVVTGAIIIFSFFGNYIVSYRHELTNTTSQIEQILEAVEDSARVGIYAENATISQDIVDGLLRSEFVCSATIVTNAEVMIAHGSKVDDGTCRGAIAHDVGSPFGGEKIGQIKITIDLDRVRSIVRRNALMISLDTALSIVVASAVFWAFISRLITRPLLSISRQLREIGGRRDGRLPGFAGYQANELGQLVSDINDLLEQRSQAEDQVLQQAQYDMLTGLPNRRLFRDRLESAIYQSQRFGHKFVVMFMDLDRFKEINDRLGHDMGDTLLMLAAKRMSALMRQSDTVARLGGDEFAMILTGVEHSWQAESIAGNLIRAIEQPFDTETAHMQVSASLGMTRFPDDAESADILMKNADQAMYAAKAKGGNCYHWFTTQMEHAAEERAQLVLDLRTALRDGHLELYYQPIIDLRSGRIVKAEALIRWNHPRLGCLLPASFIPLAEETGLILPIGDWVFQQAARTAKRWMSVTEQRDNAEPPIRMSVNASSRQFKVDFDGKDWLDFLKREEITPRAIIIEITESLFLDDFSDAVKKLSVLRNSGIEISIDDFGTGYSSLKYLQNLPVDSIKIDKSFIHSMDLSENNKSIVEAILALAQRLRLQVVAEGIETEAQRASLAAAGCDFGQGWLFAKPMPVADFIALVGSPHTGSH